MKDKKIALFMLSPLTHGGGAEKYFINLAKNLDKENGIKADVITFDDKSFRRFARLLHAFTRGNIFGKIDDYERGMRETRGDIEKGLGGARWIESPRKKLGKIFRNYDIIYAKNELIDLFNLKMIGYKKLPPIIVGVHTPIIYPKTKSFSAKLHNFLYSIFIYKWLLKGVKCVHVSNSSAKDLVDKKFRARSKLIYYPFSIEKIRQMAENNKSGIKFDSKKTNIIFVGRFSEQKGFDTLINIIERIAKDNVLKNRINFNVFGIGELRENIKIKKLGDKFYFVRYFGHIENKYMLHILGQQDLMVAPSEWETLPYAILEAQAMGVPVLAFNIPGPADIIENGKTGFFVKNVTEFIDKIRDFTEGKINPDKNEIIRNIKTKFDPEKIYGELMVMFKENVA